MIEKTLRELYAEHIGKSSDKWSLYLSEYDRLFNDYRDKSVRLIEIGIQNGGSLEIWSKYFKNASALIGCDINPDCLNLTYDDPRIRVIVGDANAIVISEQIFNRTSNFDIIIDDGSHLSSDIIKSFCLYFPHLIEGGIFVVEDLHCSYWNRFEGGLFDPYSSISFFKRIADIINHEHWGLKKARDDILHGFFAKYECEVDAESLVQIHSIEFINSMCVVRKAPANDNGLGRRIMAGSVEAVVSGHRELDKLSYQLDPIFDQSSNPWSAMEISPDEAMPYLEAKVAERDAKVASLYEVVAEREVQIACLDQVVAERGIQVDGLNELLARRNLQVNSMQQLESTYQKSISWRITAPMRLAGKGAAALTGNLKQAIKKISPNKTNVTTRHKSFRGILLERGHHFYLQHLKDTRLGQLIAQQVLKHGLVNISELQISALSYDSLAIEDAVYIDAAQVEADSRVPGFHLSPPLNLQVSDALAIRPHINVLLPSLRLKHMSGGPNTALLLAALLAEKGEYVRLIACDAASEQEESALFPHMDNLLQRPVARERIELVDAFDRTLSHAIGANDLFLATAWWTAQMAKYAVALTAYKTFIYLIQDFEPILHEGSTFQARALETYGLRHVPVINTRLLLDHLASEGAGCYADRQFSERALWFEPALDRGYYFPDKGLDESCGKKVLLFYARPTVARRNLFEIGLVALRRAVASGAIDKDHWEVWAMGENLAPVALGNGLFLNPLPWMSFDDYAKRVRTADLMLSLMLSPHPSYPPLEMAASGKLVVTNSFSVKTGERLRALSPNILVAEPTAESIAAALENAAGRINVGLPSYDPSGVIALPSNWDQTMLEVVPALLQRIQELRDAPLESDASVSPGLPSVPKTEYESYRKSALARRRREGIYLQEPGLLSFVTSAYNTDPSFLRQLASCMFMQDGGMHFEWLILDNGSTNDQTRHALQEISNHPGVRLERVKDNLGIIGGMRYCLERAGGRYILPLDSDDLIEPDCVHVLTRFIKKNDYPPLLYTDEDKLGDEHFGLPYFKPDWDPVLFLHSCYIAHLCIIDREKAIELGLYTDRGSEGCHDWDSFIRFMNAGYVPYHIPEVLYSWRMHSESTSGNIASKSYITDSHRNTLQRFLNNSNIPNIELVKSPLFGYNVDWWFKRKHVNPRSMQTITVATKNASGTKKEGAETPRTFLLNSSRGLGELAAILEQMDSELIHLCWQDVTPDDDEWQWDAMALLELFDNSVMVGGILHDGRKIVDGPRVFGFGNGFDCPDSGRTLEDPGYGAKMWKPHTVSAVSTAHCVIRVCFLRQSISKLLEEAVSIEMLGLWLGARALETGGRVIYSPFMRAQIGTNYENTISPYEKETFLSRYWSLIPDRRGYSARLGLDSASAYSFVEAQENISHLLRLRAKLLPYDKWIEMHIRRRADLYPIPDDPACITLITTVYEGTNIDLLDVLAESITTQTVKASQWVIVVHGPIAAKSLDHIAMNGDNHWGATVVLETLPLGIMGAMRRGLESAQGEYIVPVDSDDVLTPDAIQIMTNAITKLNRPDLIFSDEDLLVGNQPASPYLRGAFDAVLNLDSSYIWHLCAINRERALALELYTDPGATWCHDWDSVMRVANAKGRLEHIPEVLYHWRQHSGSTTNNAQGDPRSLDSIRHVLEQQIARRAAPGRFYVADWPANRGARELYIAREPSALPPFIWIGDVAMPEAIKCPEDAILAFAASGVSIESQQVFGEVVRLLELHPCVGAVGGLVSGQDGVVVDGCYIINGAGMLESLWLGQAATYGGPHVLALKPQSVTTTGNSLAFFRVSALKQAGAWPLEINKLTFDSAILLCGLLAANNWTVAFSPLIQASAGLTFRNQPIRTRPNIDLRDVTRATARYGSSRGYRN